MYDTPKSYFMEGDIAQEISDGASRWAGWFSDEIVFNTNCLWHCSSTDKTQYC